MTPQPRDRESETGRICLVPDDARSAEELEQERAFQEYVVLARKALKTLRLQDAIAAGKAWGRFVYLFCSEKPK